MFVEIEDTPNPNTLKFIPGVQVLQSGVLSITSAQEAQQSPLASTLFETNAVKSILLAEHFISITKHDSEDWSYLKPIFLAKIVDHFVCGMPILSSKAEAYQGASTAELDPVTKMIIEIIENKVRPSVAQDGGDIIFKDFKDGIVYLQMQGACAGCPSSSITLKSGIENMLRHYVPEVESVEAV